MTILRQRTTRLADRMPTNAKKHFLRRLPVDVNSPAPKWRHAMTLTLVLAMWFAWGAWENMGDKPAPLLAVVGLRLGWMYLNLIAWGNLVLTS